MAANDRDGGRVKSLWGTSESAMYSLDVARWRERMADQHAKRMAAKQPQTAVNGQLPLVESQDKRTKQLYGKTTQEMYESYLGRVDHWIQDAPSKNWTKDYAKETTYERTYMPRVRRKELEHGGPVVKIGVYSPRGVYKGGGQCVRREPDKPVDEATQTREMYKLRVRNFEIARDKDKEIQPAMVLVKNKPLECGKYFVQDILNSYHSPRSNNQQQASVTKRKCEGQSCCCSPERDEDGNVATHYYSHPIPPKFCPTAPHEPPMTAEYVASPQWRTRKPQKWVAGEFVATITSTNPHTATQIGISGQPYSPTVLICDKFVPPRPSFSSSSPVLDAHEHERRSKTAAAQAHRPMQRTDKSYFTSMWTEPPPGSPPKSPESSQQQQSPPTSPFKPAGRSLMFTLQTEGAIKSGKMRRLQSSPRKTTSITARQ